MDTPDCKCFRCANGVLMPTGDAWCGLVMKPIYGCDDNFIPGKNKLYKAAPRQRQLKQKTIKPKVKQPLKPKPISSKKKSSQQQRLF